MIMKITNKQLVLARAGFVFMKSEKLKMMKKLIAITAVSLFLCHTIMAQPERDVLAVQGAPGNSFDWEPEINAMRSAPHNYRIRSVFSILYFSNQNTVPINVVELDRTIKFPLHSGPSYANVLGLGHDTGGLAIRGLKETNSDVTGQILVGTPNRGSNFLRELNSDNASELSPIENFVKNIDEWKGGVDCPECNKTELLLEYLDRIKDQPYSFGAINDPNSYYNLLPEVDHSTTAVIWGNAEGQTIGDLLGSTGGVQYSSNVDLQGCADRLREYAESDIALEEEIRIINSTLGILPSLLELIGGIVDRGHGDGGNVNPFDPRTLWELASELIKSNTETLIADIRARHDIDRDIQDLMICELANQRLEAEWIIKVMGEPTGVQQETIENPNYDAALCTFNTYNCQYNQYHPDHATFCLNQELYCHETVYIWVFEENDLVYTKTEQTIPNSLNEYRIWANHLQEQQWQRNQGPLIELYSGNRGPAFEVPK